jgi:hypothetical protein
MATIWKTTNEGRMNRNSTNQKSSNRVKSDTIFGTTLSSWSRQQKLAMMAGFAILGLLLAISACSKQSPKPALVGASSPIAPASSWAATAPETATTVAVSPAPNSTAPDSPAHKKSAPRKRPANVVYSDPNSGVSFVYPRKFALASGDKAQPKLAGLGDVAMNFVQLGGVAIATVSAPNGLYPGTDFASAFFNVNVNRSVSEQECEHFAFVDTRNADGEPVDAEKVKIGSSDMERTSSFSGSALTQAATQYYHSYENGACYEYVLGLSTAGYGAQEGIEPVNLDEVFARLEKILATVKINPGQVDAGKVDPVKINPVKINPAEAEHVSETAEGIAGGKE